MSPLKRLRELLGAAFRTPWTYENWEINCPQIDEGTECGYGHNLTTILSPTEYPDGQVIAQIDVPGIERFADANGALIVAAVNALPALLDVAEAAEALRTAYNTDSAEFAEPVALPRLWAALARLGER